MTLDLWDHPRHQNKENDMSGPTETVSVVVMMGDSEEGNIWEAEPDEYEGSTGYHFGTVPRTAWDAYLETLKAANEAHADIIKAAGYDIGECRSAERCASFVGEDSPGEHWYQMVLKSASPDEWPARDVQIGRHHESAIEAEAALAELPDEFLLVDGFSMANVTRDRFTIERSGWGPRPAIVCDRCGWTKSEHEASA